MRKASVKQARSLRQTASYTERDLWRLLRSRRLEGLKFRRQVPVGPFVVDFVCLRHRLVIEADGPFHDAERDAVRDAWLSSQGFRVLRFENAAVHSLAQDVVSQILAAVACPPYVEPE